MAEREASFLKSNDVQRKSPFCDFSGRLVDIVVQSRPLTSRSIPTALWDGMWDGRFDEHRQTTTSAPRADGGQGKPDEAAWSARGWEWSLSLGRAFGHEAVGVADRLDGRRRDIGLGSARLVSLAEARETAALYRKTARDGGDPIAEHRRIRNAVPTFEQGARLVHANHQGAWRNQKHAAQWLQTLAQYAFPVFGDRGVDQVEAADVLRALTPIWIAKPEMPRRVRQRIRAVFDWLGRPVTAGGDNPVDGFDRLRATSSQTDQRARLHFAAMPYNKVSGFVARPARKAPWGETTKLAFEFLVLTAARTGEVPRRALGRVRSRRPALWTIPATRTKTRREHRVPLAPLAPSRSSSVRGGCRPTATSCSRAAPAPQAAVEYGLSQGSRSAWKPPTSPPTGSGRRFATGPPSAPASPHEVAEMALAHVIKNKAEAAYRRGDLLEK